uniref:Uncharacterized protein n=1 Tax=Candidatus Kentrum sp. FW TaxID=2126338 RepID=A0A450TVK3_9GAMM|nr:MAG: hypothetical protein BECKFW1821C_GA0114237_104224 [Candidatus Kentron sp. FW]
MFDFIEEAFDQISLLVGEPIDLARRVAVAAWRDDSSHTQNLNDLDESIAVISFIANDGLCSLRHKFKKGGLLDVAGLPTGQHKVQGIPQCVTDSMDFRTESTPQPTQRLGFGIALGRTHRAGMSTDNDRVD